MAIFFLNIIILLENDSVTSKNNIKKQKSDISVLEYFNKNIFNENESLNKKDLYNIYLNNTDSQFVYNRFNTM